MISSSTAPAMSAKRASAETNFQNVVVDIIVECTQRLVCGSPLQLGEIGKAVQTGHEVEAAGVRHIVSVPPQHLLEALGMAFRIPVSSIEAHRMLPRSDGQTRTILQVVHINPALGLAHAFRPQAGQL